MMIWIWTRRKPLIAGRRIPCAPWLNISQLDRFIFKAHSANLRLAFGLFFPAARTECGALSYAGKAGFLRKFGGITASFPPWKERVRLSNSLFLCPAF